MRAQERLAERRSFVGGRQHDRWDFIIGSDPEQCEIAVVAGLSGQPIQLDDWSDLDDIVEAIAQ
jgi:hypothetical protein